MNNEFETKNFFLRLHFSHVIFCHNDGARIVIRHKDASSSSVSPGPGDTQKGSKSDESRLSVVKTHSSSSSSSLRTGFNWWISSLTSQGDSFSSVPPARGPVLKGGWGR